MEEEVNWWEVSQKKICHGWEEILGPLANKSVILDHWATAASDESDLILVKQFLRFLPFEMLNMEA